MKNITSYCSNEFVEGSIVNAELCYLHVETAWQVGRPLSFGTVVIFAGDLCPALLYVCPLLYSIDEDLISGLCLHSNQCYSKASKVRFCGAETDHLVRCAMLVGNILKEFLK